MSTPSSTVTSSASSASASTNRAATLTTGTFTPTYSGFITNTPVSIGPTLSTTTADSNPAGFGNNNPSIASSASLYRAFSAPIPPSAQIILTRDNNPMSSNRPVYTFLATLVLLLSVSAAIVVRSFVLRRRHRAMVEEAIRNGTWVVPSPTGGPGGGGRGGPKVDLSKKPKMYEAYLDAGTIRWHNHLGGAGAEMSEKDWETIKPFSAAYVSAASSMGHLPSSTDNTSSSSPDAPSPALPIPTSSSRSEISQPPPPPVEPPQRRTLLQRITRVLSPTSSSPTSPLPSSPAQQPGSRNPSAVHLPLSSVPEAAVDSSKIRVAVLIAMPTPHSHNRSTTVLPHPLASAPQPESRVDDDEEPLPHLEMGVAELPILAHEDADDSARVGLDGRKESMGSRDSASLV